MLVDEGKLVRVVAGSMRRVPTRQDLKPKFTMQTLAFTLAHRCRSILITMSEPSTPWLATLRLRLMCLAPRNNWSSDRRPHHHTGKTHTRFTALGGAPMDGPRHIWWNFVSSRKDRISVPGEVEFIPLQSLNPKGCGIPDPPDTSSVIQSATTHLPTQMPAAKVLPRQAQLFEPAEGYSSAVRRSR